MERKSTERAKYWDDAFTRVHAADTFCSLCTMVDINPLWIDFRYLTSVMSAAGPANLSLFQSLKPDIHIDRISCEVIHDRVILDLSPGKLTVRRCGVKFGEMEPEQTRKIKMLLVEAIAGQK